MVDKKKTQKKNLDQFDVKYINDDEVELLFQNLAKKKRDVFKALV